MRMSCNGCRVLRKGCSENCTIRPCLQWIKSPESQANATVFLAKFYGRAGLMNLINAGPDHLRPAIFRSLLYEACGRIVNPIYGSVGLLWSGSWQLCQAAVEAVLKGAPIVQIPSETAVNSPTPPLKAYDIRHVSKDDDNHKDLHKVKSRTRFKRSAARPKQAQKVESATDEFLSKQPADSTGACNHKWGRCYGDEFNHRRSAGSRNSSVSRQQSEPNGEGDSRDTDSMFSVETEEASLVSRAKQEPIVNTNGQTDDSEIELELTLGLDPVSRPRNVSAPKEHDQIHGSNHDRCSMELSLDYTA